MSKSNEISIPLSKSKVIFLTLGSLIFVALGCWFLSGDPTLFRSMGPFSNPILIYGSGLASVLFFGWWAVIWFKKLFDPKPGLVLSEAGIIDNSSGLSAGFIPWSKISAVRPHEIQGQRFIVVLLVDPAPFLDMGGPVKRWFSRTNLKMCGSPITISANALQTDFETLHDLFATHIKQYGINA
jgi:hypothetical protein